MDKIKSHILQVSGLLAVMLSLYQLYVSGFQVLPALLHRSAHLGFILALVFLTVPYKKGAKVGWLDVLLAFLAVAPILYIWLYYDAITYRIAWVTPLTILEYTLGVIFVAIVIEATRRTLGNALAILCGIFLLYALFGNYLPGRLGHSGLTIVQLLDQLYLTTEGIFGSPIAVSADYVALFVIFGSLLQQTGGADFFMNLASAIAGRRTGGPAQIAVLSSAFFGTISGAAVANVVTTGQITIPMMKKIGYRPEFAAAVEAVASTGGQIMPPVMASAAFLMAEFLGISYLTVLKHAIIPALLYYGACSIMVYIESKKQGIEGLPADQVPRLINVMQKQGYHLIPLIVLVGLMVLKYSPMYAAFYAIITSVLIGFIQKEGRLDIKKLLEGLKDGGINIIPVAMACAAAGIIVGIVNLTGLGVVFGSFVISLSKSNLFLALLVTAIAVMILGMGLPTAAAYVVCVALIIPALIKLGVLPVAAHMFVLYFAVLSSITPPVALSSFAAAGLAGADFWKTGFEAMRLGIASYIVPFMFAYAPSLLLMGEGYNQISTFITAPIGVFCLAIAAQGWWRTKAKLIIRLLFFAAAIGLIFPGWRSDLLGIILATIGLLYQFKEAKKETVSINA